MRKKWYFFILIVCCFACTKQETEKHQGKRDNVVDVSDMLTEIKFDDLIFNRIAEPYVFNDYLVIVDPKSYDNLIYVFDKDSFGYITSAGQPGRGPGEITNVGEARYDKTNNELLVTDHSKQCVFAYSMDSFLLDPVHLYKDKTGWHVDHN